MKSLMFMSIVLLVGAAVWWQYPTAGGRTQASQGHDANESAPAVVEPRTGDEFAGDSTDRARESLAIASLRLQLADKDRTIQALLLRSDAAPKAPPPSAEEPETYAILAVANALDQRLAHAPRDDAVAIRLQREMESAIRQLSEEVETELDCSSTLCRLMVRAEDETLQRAILDVTERMPKSFAGAVVLRTAQGENALYAAPDSETLDVQGGGKQDDRQAVHTRQGI